jgi:uncharacterized membrane protein
MSELIVAGFKGEFSADEVMLDLMKMRQIHLVDLDYAVVASRREDGSLSVRHNSVVVSSDAAAGGQWGTLFAGPAGFVIGAVIGAAIGETVKVLRHLGIDDEFVAEVSDTLEKGNSAIFIKVRKALSEKVIEELRKFNARLLRTSLDTDKEAELMKELGQSWSQGK